jgi:hypothetical protein
VSRALGWPHDHLLRVLLGETSPAAPDTAHPTADTNPQTEIVTVLRRIDQHLATIARHLTATGPAVAADRPAPAAR